MANEFIARNGIRVLQDSQITGSLEVSSTVTASGFSGDGSQLTGLTVSAVSSFLNEGNDNYVITSTGTAGQINAESNLQFDGSKLTVTGEVSASSVISASAFWGDGSQLTNVPHVDITPGSNISQNNSNGTVIQDLTITLDGDGHVTTATAGTVDLDGRYYTETEVDTNFATKAGVSGSFEPIITVGTYSTPAGVSGSFQPLDSDLTTLAGLSSADSNFIVGSAGGWVVESGATVRTSLGLGTGDSPQFTNLTLTGDATINGDLTVLGDATQIQVSEVKIEDKLITVASGSANSLAADGGGLEIEMGGQTNPAMTWDHTAQNFNFNYPISSSQITASFSGDGSQLTGIPTDLQSVTDNGSTTTTSTTFNGGVVVHGVQYTSGSGVGQTLDNGTFTISQVPVASYDSAQFDYVLNDGTNYRAGTVISVWDGTSAEYTDYSTTDIGDTTGVEWSVDINTGNARLRLTVPDVATAYTTKVAVRAL